MRVLPLLLLLLVPLFAQQPAPPTVEEGKWAFVPEKDDFRPDALLDLRSLNEAIAGERGFIKVDANGDFTLGDGSPVRFWAVNTTVQRTIPFVARPLGRKTEPQLDQHARFLAKRGVNMVRLHAFLNPDPKSPSILAINEQERDWIWRTVAAMKREGIYTTISPYWANNMKFNPDWGLPGGASLDAHGLLFFDDKLQEAYRSWLKALFAEVNPYTGVKLASDPAVAIVQLQNEDSLLFWTVNNLKAPYREALGRKFHAWVIAKYGSWEATAKAWSNNSVKGDDPAGGVLEFHNLYEMTQNRSGGFAIRLGDQLQFWTETMMNFNRSMETYLRTELGVQQLINAGNWKTGDPVRLEDAERYSYTANQVLAVNRYYTGVHRGPNNGWAIIRGDEFTSPSILKNPRDFPLNLKQVKGLPMMVTESLWVPPMAYTTEGPFLVAAYQSLTGIDAYFWFSTADDEWTDPQSANGYLQSQMKWSFGTPDVLGTFPAAALLYRKGYLRRGEPVVVEERSLSDLWARRTPIIAESASFDPNRDAGDIAPESSVKTGVDPAAFLAGPVLVVPGGNPAATQVTSLDSLVLNGGKRIRAITGEIELDTERGLATVNAAMAQGAAGFFNNTRIDLGDLSIQAGNDYGSVLVVSLDGLPLSESASVLVQAATRSRPTGWEDKAKEIVLSPSQAVQGSEVVNFGRAPWQIMKADFTIGLRNPSLTKATVLDPNFNARGELQLDHTESELHFRFPEDALYVVLQR